MFCVCVNRICLSHYHVVVLVCKSTGVTVREERRVIMKGERDGRKWLQKNSSPS